MEGGKLGSENPLLSVGGRDPQAKVGESQLWEEADRLPRALEKNSGHTAAIATRQFENVPNCVPRHSEPERRLARPRVTASPQNRQ